MIEPRFRPGDRVYHIGAKLVPAGEYEVEQYSGTFRDSLGEDAHYYRLIGTTYCLVSEDNLRSLEEIKDADTCAAPDLSTLFGGVK